MDMLLDIPYLADWKKIGDYRQCQTDLSTLHENRLCLDLEYTVGDQVLLWKEVYSAKQKVIMNVILGLSHQFIKMGQLEFNMEQNKND